MCIIMISSCSTSDSGNSVGIIQPVPKKTRMDSVNDVITKMFINDSGFRKHNDIGAASAMIADETIYQISCTYPLDTLVQKNFLLGSQIISTWNPEIAKMIVRQLDNQNIDFWIDVEDDDMYMIGYHDRIYKPLIP
jgi:hypothetical protein